MDKKEILNNAKERYIFLKGYFEEATKEKKLKKINIKIFLDMFEELEKNYIQLIDLNVNTEIKTDYYYLYQHVRNIFNQKIITKKIIEFYDGKTK